MCSLSDSLGSKHRFYILGAINLRSPCTSIAQCHKEPATSVCNRALGGSFKGLCRVGAMTQSALSKDLAPLQRCMKP